MLRRLIFVVSVLCLTPSAGHPNSFRLDAPSEASVYAGVQSKEVWQDSLTTPWNSDYYDDGLVGAAAAWFRPLNGKTLSAGLEFQANLHFGQQSYGEFNLPLVLRYAPQWAVPVRSFAFGLGPSAATTVPEIEVDKGGASQEILFYWYMEIEFGRARQRFNPFLRLHHRSNGFDTFTEPGSSNAIVLGLRRRY